MCLPGGPRHFPGAGAAGKAGALMAGATVREIVTLAGRAERARAARAFVSEVLGPGHPCGDVAVLLVSEVFGASGAACVQVSAMPGRLPLTRVAVPFFSCASSACRAAAVLIPARA